MTSTAKPKNLVIATELPPSFNEISICKQNALYICIILYEIIYGNITTRRHEKQQRHGFDCFMFNKLTNIFAKSTLFRVSTLHVIQLLCSPSVFPISYHLLKVSLRAAHTEMWYSVRPWSIAKLVVVWPAHHPTYGLDKPGFNITSKTMAR